MSDKSVRLLNRTPGPVFPVLHESVMYRIQIYVHSFSSLLSPVFPVKLIYQLSPVSFSGCFFILLLCRLRPLPLAGRSPAGHLPDTCLTILLLRSARFLRRLRPRPLAGRSNLYLPFIIIRLYVLTKTVRTHSSEPAVTANQFFKYKTHKASSVLN